MDFDEVLAQVLELLRREGRLSYRALKRRFSLDDEYLEDLKAEIIDAKRLAVDEGGTVLVWAGAPPVTGAASEPRAEAESRAAASPTISAEGERRQLTVMFCDVVGYTPLSERSDPEELRELIRAYQQACVRVISRFEGHVAKYLGDGLLAYFGYPRAHEDDAQRSVRAGLGIVAEMRMLNQSRAEMANPVASLQVRVGIHTGLVVVGEMGAGAFREQSAIVGDTPNTAARLQEQARPDSVVISAATYQLVRGLFDCEPLGPQLLKGFSAPIQLYQVLRESDAHSRFDVAVQTGLTPLVGRDNELGILSERWERARHGEGQVVLLSGEPGIGKSRLVQAFKRAAAIESHGWLEGHCSPYYQNSALYPVVDLLQGLLHIERDDSPAAKLDKLESSIKECALPQHEYVHSLASLLSLSVPDPHFQQALTPEAQKEKTYQAIQDWLLAVAERQGLILLFEDLHWADPSTLELLGYLLEQVPTTRILLVLTHRPEFIPPWATKSHLATIILNRLPRGQAEAMVSRITVKPLPPQVLDQIVAKTDGVPLFVEELTKTVLESGLLNEEEEHYGLTGPLPPLAIPATLQDSLMARLDRLSTAREVAQLAATLGREFSHELLAAISSLDGLELEKEIGRLIEAEVLYRRGVAPRVRYFFKHALIRDTAYESLLKSKRQQIHSRIARVMEESFPESVINQPELVAHHYAEAGLWMEAIPYWHKAGERALEQSANFEAISHFGTALKLFELVANQVEPGTQNGGSQQRCVLLFQLGEAQRRAGDPQSAQKTLLQAAEFAQQLGSSELLINISLQFTRTGYQVGLPTADAVPLLKEALMKLSAQDSVIRTKALDGLARALSMTGDQRQALQYAEEGISMARRLEDRESIARNLGGMYYALQGPDHAERRFALASEMNQLVEFAADKDVVKDKHALYIHSLFETGDTARADVELNEYDAWAEESRQPFNLALAKVYRATRELIRGRFSEAEQLAQRAYALGRQLQTEAVAGTLGLQMFSVRREQGRLRELEPLIKYFLEQSTDAPAWRPGLALIYAELGRKEEAGAQFEKLAQVDFVDIPRDILWMATMTYLADTCAALGDKNRAAALYKLLLPYAHLNSLVGVTMGSYGAVSRYLGTLAAVLEMWNLAEAHFEHAVDFNARMQAHPWLAHTQYQYATMLLSRDQVGDREKATSLIKDALATARELGMRALEERIISGSN
jgi:class 3 adenylate cyclase/tetratricopeptide (TPR) repeat protein